MTKRKQSRKNLTHVKGYYVKAHYRKKRCKPKKTKQTHLNINVKTRPRKR
ncbi:MAG: hypothetical protein P8Y70_01525 [Candidatus Lokiarchaeota archaeon]